MVQLHEYTIFIISGIPFAYLLALLAVFAFRFFKSPSNTGYVPVGDVGDAEVQNSSRIRFLDWLSQLIAGVQILIYSLNLLLPMLWSIIFDADEQLELKFNSLLSLSSWIIVSFLISESTKSPYNIGSFVPSVDMTALTLIPFYTMTFGISVLQMFLVFANEEFQMNSFSRYSIQAALCLSVLVLEAMQRTTTRLSDIIPENDPKKPLQTSREATANIFSYLSYAWLDELIFLGNKRPLVQSDIWDLMDCDKTEIVMERFRKIKKLPWFKGRLLLQLVAVSRRYLAIQYISAVFAAILSISSPFWLNKILLWLQNRDEPVHRVVLYLLGMFITSLISDTISAQQYFNGRRVGTQFRTILNSELYRKSLQRISGATPQESTEKPDDEKGSSDEEEKASLANILQLMSNDTEKIRVLAAYSHDALIRLPITVVVSIIALFVVVGPAALFGLAIMLITGPLTAWTGALYNTYQDKVMTAADKRVNLTNEILQGIRIVKYFAWEPKFREKISELRDKELKQLVKIVLLTIAWANTAFSSGIFVTCATFYAYVSIFGNKLDAATAFTALKLLHQTSANLGFLPEELVKLLQARVSFDRILKFLNSKELEKYSETDENEENATVLEEESSFVGNTPAVAFRNAWFTYFSEDGDESSNSSAFTLRNIDVDFRHGSLNVVTGATGSGKTSLLLALLGEMKRLKGKVYLPDPRAANYSTPGYLSSDPTADLIPGVAYVAQSAWLLNATIRENILFGLPYEETRYKAVIEGCALVKDLQMFDGGDSTEIGEKGINLSGGQKQRISLARAAYSRAEIVLLDDPLSAVDAPTAKHLFKKCILGLLRNRTRILVTHAVPLVIPFADYVVLLKSGEIISQGTVFQVSQEAQAQVILGTDALTALQAREDRSSASSSENPGFLTEISEIEEADAQFLGNIDEKKASKLVEEEERSSGAVRLEVYDNYRKAAGGWPVAGAWVFSFVLLIGMQFLSDAWLSYWTNNINNGYSNASLPIESVHSYYNTPTAVWNLGIKDYAFISVISKSDILDLFTPQNTSHIPILIENLSPSNQIQTLFEESKEPDNIISVSTFILIYSLLGLGLLIADNINMGILYTGVFKAARTLHRLLLNGVLGAPMRFFETTPTGRILNRFSRDMSVIDQEIQMGFHGFLRCIGQIILITIIVTFVVPPFLIIFPLLAWLYVIVAQAYLNASRELKRLESISRSPVYALFSETLTGVVTIRAYGQEDRFEKQNNEKMNTNHRSFFYLWVANRWLCWRTDVISAVVVLVAGAGLVASGISPGWAGLCLSNTLEFTEYLLWLVRSHAEMEMGMNGVERILEYSSVEQEAPAILEPRPPAEWPSSGSVKVKNLTVKYAPELEPVLMDLTFNIQGGHKVGVVGRTGAGKSSLCLAFFRILPFVEGEIEIDGINTHSVGLHDLRSRLTIIPQDPVLFSGNLRQALDPLEEQDDAAIWASLNRVRFLESMQQHQDKQRKAEIIVEDQEDLTENSNTTSESFDSSSSLTLEYVVAENGSNFSQGQRQLLCMARALLRQSKLVILDEATASVDNATDVLIQETIRSELVGATVLTIAHRLRTVIDYDRILVLDQGRIVEYDTPLNLISKSGGFFRKMCEETGEFEELVELAKQTNKNESEKEGDLITL